MTNLVSPFSVWVQSANDKSSTQVNIILDLVTNNHTYWKWIETDRGSPTTDRIKWTLDAVKNEARGEKCNCKNCMSKVNSTQDMGLQWWENDITVHAYMHAWLFRFVVAPDLVFVSEPMIINLPGRFVHFCFERISNTCGESRKVMKHITSRIWTWTYTQQQKKNHFKY